MEQDIRERIALERYQIISPVLAEPARAQNEYFRQQAERMHDFPRYGLTFLLHQFPGSSL